jgi:hypothetical protein
MTRHVPNPHTAQQMRQLSNIAHVIEGGIITSAASLALRDAFSDDGARGRLPMNLLAGAGAVLGAGLVSGSFHHGGPAVFFQADAQQRQHLEMAALMMGSGLAGRAGTLGVVVGEAATARIGDMFLTHPQHGRGSAADIAKRKHARLGKSFIAAAGVGVFGELLQQRWLRALSAAVLLGAGLQLLTYKEPEQAYEEGPGSDH